MKVFSGKVPFSEMTDPAAISSIMGGKRPTRPNHCDFTESLWALTQKCWDEEAQNRPEVREVIKVLKDLSAFILRLQNKRSTDTPSQKH